MAKIPPGVGPRFPQVVVLFGATGDLAQRMLLPSLFGLCGDGLLPKSLRIVGTARSEITPAAFKEAATRSIEKYVEATRRGPAEMKRFIDRLDYVSVDVSNPDAFGPLAKAVGPAPRALSIFLSTAPTLFEATIRGLQSSGLADDTARLALEKPLGTDLASSREINDAVAIAFPEDRTFRIDQYLGK